MGSWLGKTSSKEMSLELKCEGRIGVARQWQVGETSGEEYGTYKGPGASKPGGGRPGLKIHQLFRKVFPFPFAIFLCSKGLCSLLITAGVQADLSCSVLCLPANVPST